MNLFLCCNWKIFTLLIFVLISQSIAFRINKDTQTTPPKLIEKEPKPKFKPLNTPNILWEELFKEKFGSFIKNSSPTNTIPNSSKSFYQSQIFVTYIDGVSAGSFQTEDGDSIFFDYMDSSSDPANNFTLPIVFVVMQNVAAENCTVTNSVTMHQKGSHGNLQWETSVSSSSFGQQSSSQSQSNADDGFQNQNQQQQNGHGFGQGNNNNKSWTTFAPMKKFNTIFPTMKPFGQFQK